MAGKFDRTCIMVKQLALAALLGSMLFVEAQMATAPCRRKAFSNSISPTSVSQLTHWWKADSLSLTDGTKVGNTGTEWVDLIGGLIATNSTANQRPTFKTGVANGLPGVLFTNLTSFATQNSLLLNSAFTHTNVWTVVAVIKASTTSGEFQGGSIVGGPSDGFADQDTSMLLTTLASAGTHNSVLTGLASDKGTVLSVCALENSGNPFMFRNNVDQGSLSSHVVPSYLNIGYLGAAGNINGSGTANVRFSGYIFEILIYDKALSADERAILQTYFSRWGL